MIGMRINDLQFLADGTDGVFRPWYMTGREIVDTINGDPENAPKYLMRASQVRGESIRSDIEIGVFWTQRYQVSYAPDRPSHGRWYSINRWIWHILASGQLHLATNGPTDQRTRRW
jgi:hypothetical protein